MECCLKHDIWLLNNFIKTYDRTRDTTKMFQSVRELLYADKFIAHEKGKVL